MKKYLVISIAFVAVLLSSCTGGHKESAKTDLSAAEFSEKIKEPSSQLIDVRTPEEFAKGHLPNAKNIDWNGNDFDRQIASLDKSKPAFVYCLSGGRSSVAADKMRSEGFMGVYELKGGIMKWRASGLPETSETVGVSKGMTKQQFDEQLKPGKLILIDFYADWCAPCKRIKPYLEEISKEQSDKVEVIRINADDNKALCKELKIEGLPALLLYKNQTLAWSNTGYIDKAEIVSQINKP